MKKFKGVFFRGDTAYIRYKDEQGNDVRESTGQRSAAAAEKILAKRKTEVAMQKYFPVRQYEKALFSELEEYWWENHGKRTRSAFQYLLPRIRQQFGAMKARGIEPEDIQEFMEGLSRQGLSASSVNHHRTILNSIFSFAIKRRRYDRNPVRTVPQMKEPPGRERFLTPEEFQRFCKACKDDIELQAFTTLAVTTSMRKSEILERCWSEVHVEGESPFIFVPRTKNGSHKVVPLPALAVEALKQLPSYGRGEYVFPAKPNPRFEDPSRFKKPHAWDLGKRFRRVCREAGISNLRIHDLRHTGPTILMARGVPEGVIRKLTGHRSRELERYQHLSEQLRQQTVEIIAAELSGTNGGTAGSTSEKEEEGKQ